MFYEDTLMNTGKVKIAIILKDKRVGEIKLTPRKVTTCAHSSLI